jgi:hypothetical protein
MARYTNIYGLPQPIVKLLESQRYSRGRADISVTELINPPQITALRRAHRHEMVEDVADRFWAIMGSNIHRILEEAADSEHIPEERLFVDVSGWVVSGQVDLQRHSDTVSISDWKFTSVWSVMNPKPEWERQLNLYAYLVRQVRQVVVDRATVVAMLRDWRKANGKRINDYPPAPVVQVDIPLWPFEIQEAYIKRRVELHQEAMRTHDWTGVLPECDDDERWVRKNGAMGIRCQEDYCGVAAFCQQRAKLLSRHREEPDRDRGDILQAPVRPTRARKRKTAD